MITTLAPLVLLAGAKALTLEAAVIMTIPALT